MSAPNLTRKFIIMLGDGITPTETFAFPCGANARSVTLKNNLGEDVVLDCDDPLGAPAAIQRFLESQDTTMSISGRVAKGDSLEMWRTWADAGTEKNIRIMFDEAVTDGGGYYTVPAFLETLEWGSEGKSSATFTAAIMGSGPRAWTDAS
ncbi:phage tail tube protein [Loktanella salsilacus]|uniref:phage tail tube protein n=1 Tax=Loktanella salsilacus TaxID=195913 RepID=UPI003704B053